ncbi:MAG: ATP-binding protein [Dehalococcoidia bacterium]|nr:ATP-binding protein [Dehalococcoidia bacterium]
MSTPLRVLIVEDSEDDAVLLSRELQRAGYDPVSERVDTPEAMKAALDGQPWDVVLSDYSMPRLSMSEALTMVKEKGLDLPFIIVSGAIGEEAAVASMRAGVHDYVMKGKLARLAPVIERELREAKMRRERKRMEEALRQSEKMRALGEMAGGVAHDFNNILAIVLGRAQLALEDVRDDRTRKSIQIIEQTALDAARITQRLREFAGVRGGDRDAEQVSLNQLAEGAIQMVECRRVELKKTTGITIEIGTELNETAPVRVNSAELREALVNIIFNAMDAMPEGGTITIKSGQENGSALLSISDTGTGIPEEIRGKVFEPFFTTKAAKGTGLGLSVTYSIITHHGGSIEVESAPGKGATFHIRLPADNGVEE